MALAYIVYSEIKDIISHDSRGFQVAYGLHYRATEFVTTNGLVYSDLGTVQRQISFEIPQSKQYGLRLWDSYGYVYLYQSHIEEKERDLYFNDMRLIVEAIEEANQSGFVSRGILYWQLFEHDYKANEGVRVVNHLMIKGDLLKKAQPLCQDNLLGKFLQLANVTVTQYQLTGIKLNKHDDFIDQWYIYEVIYQEQSFVYTSDNTFKPTAKLSYYDYESAESWKDACKESYTKVKLTKLYSRTYNKQ